MKKLSPREIAVKCESIEVEARANYYRCAPPEYAARLGIEARKVGTFWLTMIPGINSEFFNRVVGFGLRQRATEVMLDDAISILRGAGNSNYQVQICPLAKPGQIPEWLVARGFLHGGNWAKWCREASVPSPAPTDLRLEEIGEQKADAFADLIIEVFSMSSQLHALMRGMVGKPGWRVYLANDGDRAVAAGALFVKDSLGWLGFGATLASHRRRGAQSALLARRIGDGMAMGCQLFTSETREETEENPVPSYRNLRRSGFSLAYQRPNYVHREGS